jgi:hypothetical protein
MQTLTFNTTTKQVQLLDGPRGSSTVMESFNNVSTVKMEGDGFYQVMQKTSDDTNSAIPVMRVPISNTNMIIEK